MITMSEYARTIVIYTFTIIVNKMTMNTARTMVSGTEFCLDLHSSLYHMCNPTIRPGPLYQVELVKYVIIDGSCLVALREVTRFN